MDIENLCEALERELNGSRGFVNNKVDLAECRRLIQEIRSRLVPFIGSVNKMVEGRGAILANADGVAKNVLKAAEERAAHMVGNSEIVRNAEIAGRKIIDEAYKQCDALVLKTKDGLDEILGKAEDILCDTLNKIRQCRYSVKSMIIQTGKEI